MRQNQYRTERNYYEQKRKTRENKIITKTQSLVACPNCGEKYFYHISKKGKQSGILSEKYVDKGFF